MSITRHLRRYLPIAVLFLAAAIAAQNHGTSPVGAWMSHSHWEPAPKEVNSDLRAAGAQVIYFQADGSFTLWSGTISSERHQSPRISEGDSETLYSGYWTQSLTGPEVRMRKVYADVRMEGETIPGQEETVMTQKRADRILFRGVWFKRTPSLDGQIQKYAVGAKQRLTKK